MSLYFGDDYGNPSQVLFASVLEFGLGVGFFSGLGCSSQEAGGQSHCSGMKGCSRGNIVPYIVHPQKHSCAPAI